jgi:hypothetical protein
LADLPPTLVPEGWPNEFLQWQKQGDVGEDALEHELGNNLLFVTFGMSFGS